MPLTKEKDLFNNSTKELSLEPISNTEIFLPLFIFFIFFMRSLKLSIFFFNFHFYKNNFY